MEHRHHRNKGHHAYTAQCPTRWPTLFLRPRDLMVLLSMSTLYLLNKPFHTLCQFTDERHEGEPRKTLAPLIAVPNVYPAGRLDYDSEGLLLLTDDGALAHRITHPSQKLPKTYWVQVEGAPDDDALQRLRHGVTLKDGPTRPAKVRRIDTPEVPERIPPVRFRASIPTHWLEITISEGRNRQVRRMTAHVGLPTLRLIRVAIGPWTLEGIAPGEWRKETVHLPQQAASSSPNRQKRGPRQGPAGKRPVRGTQRPSS